MSAKTLILEPTDTELPPLRDWQKAELHNIGSQTRVGLSASPRLGKSRIAAEFTYQRLGDGYALVLTPLAVCSDLVELFRARGMKVYPAYLRTSKALQSAFNDHSQGGTVWVMNYEKLPTIKYMLMAYPPEVLVADESHKVKSPSSTRGKILRKLAPKVKHILLMTGTLAPNGVGDLWGQSVMLKPELWGASYTAYARKHLIVDQSLYNKVLGVKDPDDLRERLIKTWHFWKREDVFGPDTWQYCERTFDLPPEAKRHYDKLAKEWLLNIEDHGIDIDATHVLSRMLRLQQITSGFLPSDNGDVVLHTAKLDLVVNDLEDIVLAREKAVVFHRFRKEGAMLEEALSGFKCPVYRLQGGDDPTQRAAEIQNFNTLAGAAIYIVQTQAGGTGISLASATHALFYSQNFSFEQELQARDRIYAPGKSRCITTYHAKRSIDLYIAKIIDTKQNMHEAIRSTNIADVLYCSYKKKGYEYGT